MERYCHRLTGKRDGEQVEGARREGGEYRHQDRSRQLRVALRLQAVR